MRALAVLTAALAGVLPAAAALGGPKADRRLLQRLLRVDGPGSGLDADTVRGLTPEQMQTPDDALARLSQRLDALEARAGVTRAGLYARARRATLAAGESQHLYADCNEPSDLALSCAGGAFRGAGESPISWMGVVQGDGTSTVDRCLVVVTAGSSAPSTEIEAEVRCLALP
jgi:hypothetical protein